jgi:predicted AAA+ superfamily ATPase
LKYGNDNISFWRKSNKEIDFLVTKNAKQIAIEVKFSDNINLKELKTLTDYMKLKKLNVEL